MRDPDEIISSREPMDIGEKFFVAMFFIVFLLIFLSGCGRQCKPVTVPVQVFCEVKDPELPDLNCPPRGNPVAPQDVISCFESHEISRTDYENRMRQALATCRAPKGGGQTVPPPIH